MPVIYRVIDAKSGETLPGMPTPTLIKQGGGDAFQRGLLPNGDEVHSDVWYARDADMGYTSNQYTQVRVIRVDA